MLNLRADHPLLYVVILVLAGVLTYGFKLRTRGIFACTAAGYHAMPDTYLGLCNAGAYGDYDHGALWFDLEPEARRSASEAQVLFLGSSRMEFALSSKATERWFSQAGLSHYLLGFTHTENATFEGPLLARLKPRAQVYILNIDNFFVETETGPGSQILHDRDIERRYQEKRRWQPLHRALCTRLARLCGQAYAYFRSRPNGHWVARGQSPGASTPVAEGAAGDPAIWVRNAPLARQFLAQLPVARDCVLLTFVPYPGASSAPAKGLAAELGMDLIYPPVEGLDLRSFDGSHMEAASAERR